MEKSHRGFNGTVTYQGKNAGLPTGTYRVAIYPARFDQPADGMTFPASAAARSNPPDVPQPFRKPETSRLTATVAEGSNHFPFELKD